MCRCQQQNAFGSSFGLLKKVFWSHQLGTSWSSMIFMTPLLGYSFMLLMCVIVSLRVGDLFFQWVALEVNMLSVIPLLVVKMRERAVLNGLKYFISQSVASLVFILRVIMGAGSTVSMVMVSVAILFKMGIPPLHSWLLRILPSLGYMEMFLLLRVQKFIPLIVLSQTSISFPVVVVLIIRCVVFLLFRLNKVGSIFILIFLSSRRNGLWVLSSLFRVRKWFLFILVYTLILGTTLTLLNGLRVFKLNDLLCRGYSGALLVGLQFFNMGGLPPFIGFMLKVIIIKAVLLFSAGLRIVLIFTSLLIIYLYTTTLYQTYCAVEPYNFNIEGGTPNHIYVMWVVRTLGTTLIMYLL